MGERRNYVVEKMRKADEIASRTSGVTRSDAERKAESTAWEEAFNAQKNAEKVGAGRGLVNPEKGKDFAKGGKVSASSRADGCCVKGKTKGRMV